MQIWSKLRDNSLSINLKKQIKAQMNIVILAKNINKTLYTT